MQFPIFLDPLNQNHQRQMADYLKNVRAIGLEKPNYFTEFFVGSDLLQTYKQGPPKALFRFPWILLRLVLQEDAFDFKINVICMLDMFTQESYSWRLSRVLPF